MSPREVSVIIIDDHPDFLEFAEGYIASIGGMKVVAKATSGEEGLEMARRLRPDLALVDVAMPGMNGFTVTRELKSSLFPPRVIVITMYDDEEYKRAAKEAGADAFVTKAEIDAKLACLLKEMFSQGEGTRRILIVDDSPTMRKMIMATLASVGRFIFHEAGNGLEAIEQLALHPIHLVSLDLNMPDMHGLEVLKFMKSHESYRSIPVVVVTTRGDEISRRDVTTAGAAAVLTKPFDPMVLARIVKNLLAGEQVSELG